MYHVHEYVNTVSIYFPPSKIWEMLLLQGIILAIPKVYIMLLLEKVTHILVSLLKVMKSNLFVSQIIITSPRTQECGHASACSSEHVI